MRRNEKEISDLHAVEALIRRAQVCRVAFVDHGKPYLVPLCFGYEPGRLYFHAAQAGRKIDILRENPQVCFEFDLDCEVVRGAQACNWSMKYRSVIGFGTALPLEDSDAKRAALDCIMEQYGGQGPLSYKRAALEKTLVFRIDIEEMSGKISGYEVS